MTILIDNFSVGLEEWVTLSGLSSFSVDVVDLSHGISTSGTTFLIDGVLVFTTFSGIVNGYIATCSAPTISGGITVTIHAENDNSEILEEDYDLLFGYRAVFDEYLDWGYGKEIVVWSTAKNDVVCPNTETFATYFGTRDLDDRSLGATIFPIGFEGSNLGASIVPQSKYFFPGYTYAITVSGVKDHSGNEMQSFTYSFTVEDS